MMDSTQEGLAFVITLANMFGLFPISTKKIGGQKVMCFKWKSFPAVYCLAIICFFSIAIIIFCIKPIMQKGFFNQASPCNICLGIPIILKTN